MPYKDPEKLKAHRAGQINVTVTLTREEHEEISKRCLRDGESFASYMKRLIMQDAQRNNTKGQVNLKALAAEAEECIERVLVISSTIRKYSGELESYADSFD